METRLSLRAITVGCGGDDSGGTGEVAGPAASTAHMVLRSSLGSLIVVLLRIGFEFSLTASPGLPGPTSSTRPLPLATTKAWCRILPLAIRKATAESAMKRLPPQLKIHCT